MWDELTVDTKKTKQVKMKQLLTLGKTGKKEIYYEAQL